MEAEHMYICIDKQSICTYICMDMGGGSRAYVHMYRQAEHMYECMYVWTWVVEAEHMYVCMYVWTWVVEAEHTYICRS